jgi:type I restriction enzyme S subunit
MVKRYSLGDVVRFKGGGTPSRDIHDYWDGDIPWATVKDFNEGVVLSSTQERISELGLSKSASNLIPQGTVVIPTRMALGKAAILTRPMAINQDLKAAIPTSDIDQRFLLWYFVANADRIKRMGKGATVQGVTLDQLNAMSFPLVDIKEQRRVAAILDKADSLRAKRREAIGKLDQLLQSVFLEMFGDPVTNPKRWQVVPLSEIGDWRSGGTPARSNSDNFIGEIPWYSSGELNKVIVRESEECISQSALNASSAKLIPPGSLLLGMYDTAAFKSSITTIPAACNQAIAFSELDRSKCSTLYVYQAIQLGKEHYKRLQRGVRQKNFNLSMIRETPIQLPPLANQVSFERIFYQYSDSLAKQQQSAAKLELLFGTIQTKLFDVDSASAL